ncbi:MAG: hypothetical protein QF787_06010 [Nitrospinota bacterium]|nr:hypothetical protein [Nitrospinota bacterium]
MPAELEGLGLPRVARPGQLLHLRLQHLPHLEQTQRDERPNELDTPLQVHALDLFPPHDPRLTHPAALPAPNTLL